jgi:NAD(P)H-dependent FMN reductase
MGQRILQANVFVLILLLSNITNNFMKRTPHIAVVLGTARTGRNSEHVAKYITDVLASTGKVDAQLYDVRDYMTDRTVPDWQPDGEAEQTSAWRAAAAKADAFIMVCPEYNSSYPGEWKMLMDQDGNNYMGKPVLVAAVSGGAFMGARVVEHMHGVLNRIGMVYVHATLYFGRVTDFVAMDTEARDEKYKKRILKSLAKLRLYEDRLHGLNAELLQK